MRKKEDKKTEDRKRKTWSCKYMTKEQKKEYRRKHIEARE